MANPFQIGIAVPFDEAIAAAKRRGVVLPEVYYGELPAAMRSRAVTVSGLAALDQVQGVMDSLAAATETGQTFRDWKKTVLADVPDLGKLPADRLDNIFRTAIQTHYNIGRWEQLESNKARRPYLMYDAIMDGRTRPSHRAMDGHIAHIDDPWWGTHFPPNGFMCRCGAIALSEAQAKARGYGTKPTPDAQPDKGWDYHPAKGQDEALRKVEVNKLAKAHPKLAMAYPRAVDALRAAAPKVSVQGRPSADFVAEMRKAVEDLPEAVKRTLSAGGVEVRVSRTLTGAFPDLKGQRPRGWPEGATWDHADGLACGKTAAVAERRRSLFGAQKGKWIDGRGRSVLTHELGHAYDSAMSRPSASESFLTAYRKDVESAVNSVAKIPDYFLQPGDAGPSEAFAEAFSQIAGSPGSYLPMPRTVAWVRSMMGL